MAINWQLALTAAEETGVKLELVGGVPTWEFFPSIKHQRLVRRIELSIKLAAGCGSDCGCFAVSDAYIKFPDGSYKRPDIAIFCKEPPDTEEALPTVPDAVVEVISRGFENKDLVIGAPFYLSQGVKDVVVVNPVDGTVHHFTTQREMIYDSPQSITLTIGCSIDA